MKSSKKRKAALLSNLFKANAVKKDIDKVRAAIPLRVPTSLKKKGRKRKRKRPDSKNKHLLRFTGNAKETETGKTSGTN